MTGTRNSAGQRPAPRDEGDATTLPRAATGEASGAVPTEPPGSAPGMDPAFDKLFAALQDAAMLVDPAAQRIRAVNPAAAALLAYDPATLAGMTPGELHPHEGPELEAFFHRAMTEGVWWTRTLSCEAATGTRIPVEVRASRVDLAGEGGLLLVIRDLRTDEMMQMARSLRKLMHDLRNTLATSQLISDRLRGHGDPSVQRGAGVISRSVERAVRMSEDILRQRHLDAPPPRRERFALADVVEEVVDALPEAASDGPATVALSGGELILDADFDQVYRIVLNLCRNALDAGATALNITGTPDAHAPAIEVRDNGPGLPDTVRARLFDSGGPGSTRGSTGLGLLIARELARAHGGDLGLVSTGPEGTAFQAILPPERFD